MGNLPRFQGRISVGVTGGDKISFKEDGPDIASYLAMGQTEMELNF
jgi:hypothetical protein